MLDDPDVLKCESCGSTWEYVSPEATSGTLMSLAGLEALEEEELVLDAAPVGVAMWDETTSHHDTGAHAVADLSSADESGEPPSVAQVLPDGHWDAIVDDTGAEVVEQHDASEKLASLIGMLKSPALIEIVRDKKTKLLMEGNGHATRNPDRYAIVVNRIKEAVEQYRKDLRAIDESAAVDWLDLL